MPPKKKKASKKRVSKRTAKTSGGSSGAVPMRRGCGTMDVHYRFMRSVVGYAEARAATENDAWRAALRPMVARAGCTKIPVVVHVVHKTAAQNISDAQVHSQITVLNEDFRKKNADVSTVPAVFQPLVGDARIEFELATTDPSGNPTNGIDRVATTANSFTDDDKVKSSATGGADAWPANEYLNIWVCQLVPWLGYAQFPGGPAATDGVVVLHTAFGTTGTASAPFDLGRTTTHEVGHWVNLNHIWGDDSGGCWGSDNVSDTPNQGGPNFGTPAFPTVSCSNGPNGDMFMNYMDYVDDVAMVMFSQGQVTRMQATLDGTRSSIGTSTPCEDKKIEPDVIKKLEPDAIKKHEPDIKKLEPDKKHEPDAIKKHEPDIKKLEPDKKHEPDEIKKHEPDKKFEPDKKREPDGIKKFEPDKKHEPDEIKKHEPDKKFEPDKKREPDGIKKFEPDGKKREPDIKKFEPDEIKKNEPDKKREPDDIKKFEPDKTWAEGGFPGGGMGPMEDRLQRLEAAIAQLTHFIRADERPDVGKAPLRNEADDKKKE